jgi:hypothetical protein
MALHVQRENNLPALLKAVRACVPEVQERVVK